MRWLDTPYLHQAMVRGQGVDCVMLVAGVGVDAGILNKEDLRRVVAYPEQWHLHNSNSLLTEQLKHYGFAKRTKLTTRQPGDIVVFKMGRCPSHCGIVLPYDNMIHAFCSTGINRVVINSIRGKWEQRLHSVYRYPGIK